MATLTAQITALKSPAGPAEGEMTTIVADGIKSEVAGVQSTVLAEVAAVRSEMAGVQTEMVAVRSDLANMQAKMDDVVGLLRELRG